MIWFQKFSRKKFFFANEKKNQINVEKTEKMPI